ncbi:MAG: hypothetical protein EOP82_12760 [Variovorax sp.]|nr:MAG: hypothetical protein EOP82_12760 [Variovorax sp.]
MKNVLASLTLALCSSTWAQGLPAFPPDAPVPKAAEITEFIKDKKFVGTRQDGIAAQFNFRSDGKFDVIFPQAKEFGTWRTEDGNLCVDDPVNGKTCNQVRIAGEDLLYRRNRNGEVVTLKPQ